MNKLILIRREFHSMPLSLVYITLIYLTKRSIVLFSALAIG